MFSLYASSKEIDFVLSVDWEGDSLSPKNIQAMQNFREKYPEIKHVHFLNAAYFTADLSLSKKQIIERIQSVLRPGDEIGLHIHPWKHFVEAAGVVYRQGPRYLGEKYTHHFTKTPGGDVPLFAYSFDEIRKMIQYSKQILEQNGFGPITSFRAGGWMASAKVRAALAIEGIAFESSAVPAQLVAQLYPKTLLSHWAKKIWSNISLQTQPFQMITKESSIMQFPNNMGLADYVSFEYFFKLLEILNKDKKNSEPLYLHYGYHQESAAIYIHEVDKILSRLKNDFLVKPKGLLELNQRYQKKAQIKLCLSLF